MLDDPNSFSDELNRARCLTFHELNDRAFLHGGGRPRVGEVTCGGQPHLSCKRDQIKMGDCMDRRVTSPTWGPPPPCKQALSRGDWLGKSANIKVKNNDAVCRLCWKLPDRAQSFFHKLLLNKLMQCSLNVSMGQ